MSSAALSEPASSGREFFTIQQAAHELGVGKRRVYAAIRRGELRAAVINERGDLRTTRDWLRAFVDRLAEKAR